MLLRLITLLLDLVAQVSAQSCSLCPGGQVPANGDLLIDIWLTCNILDNLLMTGPATTCTNSQSVVLGYSLVCGCPGVVAGTCSGICKAGTVLVPDMIVVNRPCRLYNLFAKAQSNPALCTSFQNDVISFGFTEDSPTGTNLIAFDVGSACCVPAVNGMGMGMSMGMSMADMNTRQRSLQVGHHHPADDEHLTDANVRGVARGM